jgi:hypothetical protein
LRLFTFYRGTGSDKLYHGEVLNLVHEPSRVLARVQVGEWYAAIVAPPAGTRIEKPLPGARVTDAPLYVYDPVVANGKSADAAEIFLVNEPVKIVDGQQALLETRLDRNVAMVEVIVTQATANFNKAAADNRVELRRVPSTISYSGRLLPGPAAPDTLPAGKHLRAPVKLSNHPAKQGFLVSDTVRFLIPAHRGSDFLAANPSDTIALKMLLTVDFERTGGGRFVKTKEIQAAAKCNKILRVRLNVNDGLAMESEVLPWSEVDINKTVGEEKYSNWLYVKRGENGSGICWEDALPDIASAITLAGKLRSHAMTVHGILVAGGPAHSYDEGITLPPDTRLFGGWAGTPGTELPAADAMAPYTSSHRALASHKAVVTLAATDSVALDSAATLLDGFVITGAAGSAVLPVSVNHATARINAVEIRDHVTSAPRVLSITAGTGTNLLVAGNDKGVVVGPAGKLVNATIVNNAAASTFEGTLQNSVYWGNGGTVDARGTIEHSAFPGAAPLAGKGNIPLNAVNLAWFSAANTVPGPHFNVSGTPGYAAHALTPNRSPLLGRGDKQAFDDAAPAPAHARDIDGNPRHNGATDIGCYEGAGNAKGFHLRWDMNRVYMSAKANSLSDHPLVLAGNDENVTVAWQVQAIGALTNATLASSSGSGSGNVPGLFKIMSGATANVTATEVLRGKLRVTTGLGVYLPDVEFEVYQAPGILMEWTAGYVGSFHRNSETRERYIHVENAGGWTVRVVSGSDWIKIDGNNKGAHGGVVQEIPGGELKGTRNVKFRVGMKSTLPAGAPPRYGLITIHKTDGMALFFVRQGEQADYLYRPEDPRVQGTRTAAKKFAPFTLKDPRENTSASGRDLGQHGGVFSSFPTQVGYFFQWNRTKAYLQGAAQGGIHMPSDQPYTAWSTTREPCPPGYRQASMKEWVHSIYWNLAEPPVGTIVGGAADRSNYVYGRYADGYYDQLAPDPVNAATDAVAAPGAKMARKGILMVNHYNYAAVFFPTAGAMERNGVDYALNLNILTTHSMNWLTTIRTLNSGHVTHWDRGHIGISCTSLVAGNAALVRCVKE